MIVSGLVISLTAMCMNYEYEGEDHYPGGGKRIYKLKPKKKDRLLYKNHREIWIQEHGWTLLLGCIREAWDVPGELRRAWHLRGARCSGPSEYLRFLSSARAVSSFSLGGLPHGARFRMLRVGRYAFVPVSFRVEPLLRL